MENLIDKNGKPTFSYLEAKVQGFPYWMVEGYRCESYAEALDLAKAMKGRLNRPIVIMEKLDHMTAFYAVETV